MDEKNEWFISFPYSEVAADVKINSGNIEICTKENVYSSALATKRVYDIREDSVYDFELELSVNNVQCRVVVIWLDSDLKRIACEYIEKKSEITSPERTVAVDITVVFFSKDAGHGSIGDFKLKYLRRYKPNMVTLASLTLEEFGEPEDWRALTFERILSETMERLDKVAACKPDIVVLTEHFHNAGIMVPIKERTITLNGKVMDAIKEKAKEHGMYIASSIHRETDGLIYNTGVLIDRNGKMVGSYDKSHLTFMEHEMGIVPGDEAPVFETDFGKVAFMICWDMWFPGLSQLLRKKGVQVIVNPTLGICDYQTCATAYLTGAYVLPSQPRNEKLTRVINPFGDIIADATGTGFAIAKVDLNKPAWIKNLSMNSFGDGKNVYKYECRPDMYQPLCEDNNIL